VKLHRAIALVAMMLLGVGVVVLLTAAGIATFDAHSLIALGVVLVAAAVSGVAFSWNRYFKRR
jgi:drug/metabolite transporter (DMT)-like permease